jgi:beta-xylosidase
MKRRLAVALLSALVTWPASAVAQPIRDRSGALTSCPDPSVVRANVGRFRYYLVCTSDYGANSFPIRASNDLRHWVFLGYVFPAGRPPWWALPSPIGRYWAPAIYRIEGRWVVYFAAQYNRAALNLRFPDGYPLAPGQFVIGVATASSLFGPWHTKVLHYRGQFNAVNTEHENYGAAIDPSVVRDGKTGQLYLFWVEQHSSIWASKLSPDGLTLDYHVHQEMWARKGWECNTPSHGCTIEGPEEVYRDGWFYLFYSGGSTWTGTYAVGVATSRDPLKHEFVRLNGSPVLRSGNGWLGPGGSSAPVTGPDGKDYLFYHVETAPNPRHISDRRYLMESQIDWEGLGGYYPLINDGLAG